MAKKNPSGIQREWYLLDSMQQNSERWETAAAQKKVERRRSMIGARLWKANLLFQLVGYGKNRIDKK